MYPPPPRHKPPQNQPQVPPGTYDADVVRSDHTRSRRGTPGYRVVFEITSPGSQGRCVSHTVWLTQKALPFARQWLGAFDVNSPGELKSNDLVGYQVRIRIDHESDPLLNRRFMRVHLLEARRRPAPNTRALPPTP